MKHAVIYVPGLGDHRSGTQRLVITLWQIYGIHTDLVLMNWRQNEAFTVKLERLLYKVDSLANNGYTVSLVGVSAGASAVINAYAARPNTIHRVVCICGKLQNKQIMQASSLHSHPGFSGSLDMLPDSLLSLKDSQRASILSIRPLTDETVPPSDTIIEGSVGRVIPTHGHVRSIALAITIYSFVVIRFIKTAKSEYAAANRP